MDVLIHKRLLKKEESESGFFGHTNKHCYRIGHGGSLRGFAQSSNSL